MNAAFLRWADLFEDRAETHPAPTNGQPNLKAHN